MTQLGSNTHVIDLVGQFTVDDTPVFVLEYCARGNLRTYLRQMLPAYKESLEYVWKAF